MDGAASKPGDQCLAFNIFGALPLHTVAAVWLATITHSFKHAPLRLRGGRRRAEQRRLERERQEAEAAALAKREAAIVAETARRKAQAEARERYARESREREISNLRFQVTQQKAWQRNVDHAARNAVAVQQRQALIAELDSMINPPPLPKPEPEQITYEQSDGSPHFGPDYNPKLAGQAVLRWR